MKEWKRDLNGQNSMKRSGSEGEGEGEDEGEGEARKGIAMRAEAITDRRGEIIQLNEKHSGSTDTRES